MEWITVIKYNVSIENLTLVYPECRSLFPLLLIPSVSTASKAFKSGSIRITWVSHLFVAWTEVFAAPNGQSTMDYSKNLSLQLPTQLKGSTMVEIFYDFNVMTAKSDVGRVANAMTICLNKGYFLSCPRTIADPYVARRGPSARWLSFRQFSNVWLLLIVLPKFAFKSVKRWCVSFLSSRVLGFNA